MIKNYARQLYLSSLWPTPIIGIVEPDWGPSPLIPLDTIVMWCMREFQGVSLFGPSWCQETPVSLTVVRLIIVVYFYFLVWLITDVAYYFYLFIILFRNFYSEYHVNFHVRSHLFLCASLPNMYFSELYLFFLLFLWLLLFDITFFSSLHKRWITLYFYKAA